ncbi:MAG: aminomethyl-transferring glycine dehydrogenase [Deltaproteobacteria bacterium]|nr:aminomethyl-transferring glycine dehydrogenase [Deltaproteobacteria bacterium]
MNTTDLAASKQSGKSEAKPTQSSVLDPSDVFASRHIGPSDADIASMLAVVGYPSLDALTDATVPASIRMNRPLQLDGAARAGAPRGEAELLAELRAMATQNEVFRSFIGLGYHDCITPPVVLRNVFENPGWYTQYTPYQAEIAQGRLEALLNFQTMIADLTALPIAGASLLDEATAAAEAMAMCWATAGADGKKKHFFADRGCHPQTLAVVETRARAIGVDLVVGDAASIDWAKEGATLCGVLVQYPTTDGAVIDYRALVAKAHEAGALAVMAADLLALTLLVPPGEVGADIAVGNTQRFGVPLGFGGPHAGYIATRSEYARKLPGRIIGVSRDAQGGLAYRMAIQTREQHIRRERATSNICTAQALLAIMAGFYAIHHGPEGLRRIAERVHAYAAVLAKGLQKLGHEVQGGAFFDTIRVTPKGSASDVLAAAHARRINLRDFGDGSIGIALDETASREDLANLFAAFGDPKSALSGDAKSALSGDALLGEISLAFPKELARESEYLTHPVFHRHRSETELLRYINVLRNRDLSLAHSMIALGSCTMKLNATSEMIPVSWPEFGKVHPFAPADQTRGYEKLFRDLERWLSEITGFAAVSLQPNAGSQGEFTGLLVIRAYHAARGEGHRNVCLIPDSAHGTNPASAVVAGLKVVAVACDEQGNVRVDDLRKKATEHAKELAALMITYPSTHGVFEEAIKEICEIVHQHGGQVYMDGANMNAQVGLSRPGDIGADVCHLNLHKTFAIPHGGGGAGMGPIGVARHLAPYLPGHPVVRPGSAGEKAIGAVAAAPWGSASILPISWVYIALMGAPGLKKATQVAILNANYMAKRLSQHYPVLYRGKNGNVAHEFILDVRPLKKSAGIEVDDFAKRLMDYGFHAPTMSFPVPGTLMIEPTESEPKAELDRFCDAMVAIREEIRAIEEGRMDRADNPLKHAPHTAQAITSPTWNHAYTRDLAAFPAPWVRAGKFWPAVGRIDNPYGDRNLVCICPPVSAYDARDAS